MFADVMNELAIFGLALAASDSPSAHAILQLD
jgi:hypothetical protein